MDINNLRDFEQKVLDFIQNINPNYNIQNNQLNLLY